MTMTYAQKKAYLKASHICPYCGSDQIEGQSVDIDENGASQEVSCISCKARWEDLYKLTDVREVNPPDGGTLDSSPKGGK